MTTKNMSTTSHSYSISSVYWSVRNEMMESEDVSAEPASIILPIPSTQPYHSTLLTKSLVNNHEHPIYASPLTPYIISALVMVFFATSALKSSRKGHRASDEAKTSNSNGPRCNVPPLGSWVRPLGSMECFMALTGDLGLVNTLQAIWIKSDKGPIKRTDIAHALHHVATKTQILQLCVQWHHGRPWFKRMRSVDIDFKTEVGDVMKIYYKTLAEPYSMKEGPLWRARLVIQPETSTEAVLMIAVQHVLTDGISNIILARDVITTLNASLTGRHLEVPIRPIIPPLIDEMFSFKHYPFLVYAFLKKIFDTLLIGYETKFTFKGVFKSPTIKDKRVKNLCGELTEEQTKKLLQNCKQNGVTVHSCIYAALHAAYLKMAQEMSSKKIDCAPMIASDAVNCRRYYDKTHFEDQGCHIAMIENELLIKDTHITTHKGFWELAHQVKDNLNYRLNVEMRPIKNAPLFQCYISIVYANALKNYIGGSQYTDQHFSTTNMGNLKYLLPANPGDGPVEITSLLRSVSSQYLGLPFLVAMHTFRDKFMYSIDFYSNKITDDVAHKYFSIFSHFVNNIADVGSVS